MSQEKALAELTPKIGTETNVSDWITITQEMIDQFAQATLDQQWIHVDPDRAQQESPYKTTIAHGFFTLSLIPYLSGSVNPDAPRFSGVKLSVNYGLNKVRFPHPVPVGSNLRLHTTLLQVEEVKGGLQLVNQMTMEIEGVEKPACVAETVSRIYFDA